MATQPNPNWTRWIFASVDEHFSSNVMTPNSIPYIVEGIDERDDDFMTTTDRAEIRINGPFAREVSARYWRIWVDINILVTSNMGGEIKDAYTLERNLGLIHEYTDVCIPIHRYGNGLEDDDSLLEVLRPRIGKNDSIRILHFGQINKVDRIKQAQIDARYIMFLFEG